MILYNNLISDILRMKKMSAKGRGNMTKKYSYRQAAEYLNSSGDLPDVYSKKSLKKIAKNCRLIPLYGNKYAKW